MQSQSRIALVAIILAFASATSYAQQPAEALKIVVNGQTQSISEADLQALPHHTVTVHNPHANADETYSGVLLIDLPARQGVPRGHDLRGKALSEYFVSIEVKTAE